MRSGDDVLIVNQCSAADVNRFLWVLLKDGNLPWVLPEFTITIDVHWILDATIDTLSAACSTSAQVSVRRWLWTIRWATAADLSRGTLLWTSSVVCLSLCV